MRINYLKKELIRLLFYQILTISIIVLFFVLVFGCKKFESLFFGANSYILPQIFFIIFTGFLLNKGSNLFIIGFFFGESLKVIFASLLCVLFIKYFFLDPLFSIIGFIIGFFSLWLVYGYYFLSGQYLQRE